MKAHVFAFESTDRPTTIDCARRFMIGVVPVVSYSRVAGLGRSKERMHLGRDIAPHDDPRMADRILLWMRHGDDVLRDHPPLADLWP